jgi:hypothetical protein
MGINLLHCVHCNECTGTHDAIHDTFVTIMWNFGFQMGQKQLNAFISITFNFFHWRIDNMFTKDDICTLIDVLIVDPMWT